MNNLKLTTGRELYYLNEVEVQIGLDESEEQEKYKQELDGVETSDITVHKYEGGFKIWECTIDLCEFIEERKDEFSGKKVLELGCGAALPAILTAVHGATDVVAQDFNASVIEFFTLPNFQCNEHSANIEGLATSWNDLPSKIGDKKFDIILSSETIYNEDDYQSLYDAVDATLADNGVAYFAAKFFYFGVGGSVPSFMDFVNKRGKLNAKEIKEIDASVPRRIVELRRV